MTRIATEGYSQPVDSDLAAIAALAPADDSFIQRKSGVWVGRTMAQLKTDLALSKADVGLGNVDNTADTAKPVSTAQQTALDLKTDKASSLKWISGRYYGAPIGANAAHTALRIYAFPMWIPTGESADRMGINVTTGAASALARLLVYADDGNGNPGALLHNPGADLDCSASAAKEHTGLTWTFGGGNRYVWLAMMTNASGTFSTAQTHVLSTGVELAGNSGLTVSGLGLIATVGSYVVPDPFPTPAGSTVCPMIRIRAT